MGASDSMAKREPIEILAEWEGAAVPEPGVLFEESQAAADGDAAALAAWIGVTALPGGMGNQTHDAIRAKVLAVLARWHQRFGQEKIDQVKDCLFQQMEKQRGKRKLTDDELRDRIGRLFDEIQI